MTLRMETTCPYCATTHDAVAQFLGNGEPSDGDVDMCFTCGAFAIFDHGRLRKPCDAELIEIHRDPDMRRARHAWLLA